jgi:hypothetical protein
MHHHCCSILTMIGSAVAGFSSLSYVVFSCRVILVERLYQYMLQKIWIGNPILEWSLLNKAACKLRGRRVFISMFLPLNKKNPLVFI